MKILVVGATGLTGQHLVKHLLAQGHEVTALARDPARFGLRHAQLKAVQGDARDAASLARAVQGQDAVVSAFGPRSLKKDDLQEVYMRHLVAAMTQSGVKRLVNLSALGVGDSKPSAPWVFRALLAPLFLGRVFADKERGEKILFASSLDYVNVRPGRLLNEPARGGVQAMLPPARVQAEMTREDLALFMIAQLESPQWVRRCPIIGY